MKTIKLFLLAILSDAISFLQMKCVAVIYHVGSPITLNDAVMSGTIYEKERVDIDVTTPIYKDRIGKMKLVALLDKLRRSMAKTTRIRGFEERRAPNIITLTGTNTSASTANATVVLTLTTGLEKNCYKYQTIKLLGYGNTGMSVEGYVIQDPDTANHQISVKPIDSGKKFGLTSGTTIPNTTRVLITGNWNPQLAKAVKNPTVIPNPIYNNTQTLRHNFTVSEQAMKERAYGEDELTRLKSNCEYRHAEDVYKTFIFNGASFRVDQTVASPTTQLNYQYGLLANILNNSDKNFEYPSGSNNVDNFDTFQYNLFDLMLGGGTDSRLGVANKAFRALMTQLKKDRGYYILNNDAYMDTFGIAGVETVITENGKIDLMIDGCFNEVYNVSTQPSIMALHLRYVELKDFIKTMWRLNIQDNDVLGRMDELVTEFTNLLYLPEAHGVMRQAYVAAS